MAKNNEIQKFDPKNYPIVGADTAAMRDVIEENLGGEKLTEFDLKRFVFPSGKSTSFNVEGPDGDSSAVECVGVIIAQQNRRAFWHKGIDEGGEKAPPDCMSIDGVNGYGTEAAKCGGKCEACPLSKFGSAKPKGANDKARGQACQQKKTLFIMLPGDILPVVMSLPPTSLDAWKQYLAKLVSNRVSFLGCVTKITLKKEKNAGGIEFAAGVFEMVEKLEDQSLVQKFRDAGKFFGKEMFAASVPGTKEETQEAPTSPTVAATINGTEVIDKTSGEVTTKPVENKSEVSQTSEA